MKLSAKSAFWVLPFFLTACHHKTHQQPPQTLAPPAATSPTLPPVVETPPPPAQVETPAQVTLPPPPPPVTPSKATHKPRPPVKRKPPAGGAPAQPASGAASTPSAGGASPQSTPATPAVSAIGQLSSGDPLALRKETVDSMAAIERGLNGIARALSEQEKKTADQIREYLKQAKSALSSGDVDGAHTLAAKARVLLNELSEPGK